MPVQKTEGRDEEFPVPPITTSPITGIQGAVNWGGLNKFSLGSRYVIADAEADELINFLPQLSCYQQTPGPGPTIATLPSGTVVWNYSDILNGNLFVWYLTTTGHIYQMSTGGTTIDIGAATATSFSAGFNQCDCIIWQGTNLLITDVVAQKVYSWNGTTLNTVFTSQPANFLGIYGGRLWMAHGLVITWTNAGTFNSLSGDSGSFIITDGRCANPILGMVDFSGSLYVGGSNWIKPINSLNDTGNPPVLTFQQPTLESQIGWINKWSIILVGTDLFFATINGFWMLSGGSIPVKISAPLDGFFQNIDTTNSTFDGAYGMLYNKQCIFWAVRWNGDSNYTAFGYTEDKVWFRIIAATGSGAGIIQHITGIVSSAVTNNLPRVFASDGTNVFDLFGAPNAVVTSQFNSKMWDFYSKMTADYYTNFAAQWVLFSQTSITVAELPSSGLVRGPAQDPPGSQTHLYNVALGDWINGGGVIIQWQNPSLVIGSWTGTSPQFYALDQYRVPFQDRALGVNMSITSTQAIMQAIVISYRKTMQAKG